MKRRRKRMIPGRKTLVARGRLGEGRLARSKRRREEEEGNECLFAKGGQKEKSKLIQVGEGREGGRVPCGPRGECVRVALVMMWGKIEGREGRKGGRKQEYVCIFNCRAKDKVEEQKVCMCVTVCVFVYATEQGKGRRRKTGADERGEAREGTYSTIFIIIIIYY